MILATLSPEETHELKFDLKIAGTKSEPEDIRFIIESQEFRDEKVQDLFSIICRAVRKEDSVVVYIPKLLTLFRSGSYRARLEVVLENRLFTPFSETIVIEEPISVSTITKPTLTTESVIDINKISVVVDILNEVTKSSPSTSSVTEPEQVAEPSKPIAKVSRKKNLYETLPTVDVTWKEKGFAGLKNPFK